MVKSELARELTYFDKVKQRYALPHTLPVQQQAMP